MTADAYRKAMRKAVKKEDHKAIEKTWRSFVEFCDEHGWPDWWAELQRAYMDSQFALMYG